MRISFAGILTNTAKVRGVDTLTSAAYIALGSRQDGPLRPL